MHGCFVEKQAWSFPPKITFTSQIRQNTLNKAALDIIQMGFIHHVILLLSLPINVVHSYHTEVASRQIEYLVSPHALLPTQTHKYIFLLYWYTQR